MGVMAKRLIFMGSDPIALPALEAIREGLCGPVELVAVYTQPDKARGRGKKVVANEIKEWALERDIPVYQPEKLGKAARLEIESLQVDAILVMAYGHILSQALIETPHAGIWNLHTSLLPKYRGASPIQCAIASGDSETGVTLMRMVREMDAGPILDAEKVCIGELDTALDVEAKLSAACVPLMQRNLERILEAQARPVEQDPSQATYVRKLGKDDTRLDFRVPARELARRINGLFPWPGARFPVGEVDVKVGLAASDETPCEQPAGTVLSVEAEGLRVACGRGSVLLKRLQRPGGKMLAAADFARGFELPVGTLIESRPMPELVVSKDVRS